MNKLDALIKAWVEVENSEMHDLIKGGVRADIQRILGAVLKDMSNTAALCEERKGAALCSYLSDPTFSGPDLTCHDCPLGHHEFTRSAVEDALK